MSACVASTILSAFIEFKNLHVTDGNYRCGEGSCVCGASKEAKVHSCVRGKLDSWEAYSAGSV